MAVKVCQGKVITTCMVDVVIGKGVIKIIITNYVLSSGKGNQAVALGVNKDCEIGGWVFGCLVDWMGFLKNLGIPDVLGGIQASAVIGTTEHQAYNVISAQCLCLQSLNTMSSQVVLFTESQEQQ